MATRSSTAGRAPGSVLRAVARNAVIFLICHALFRGNEVLWIVFAVFVGVVVGATGMWLFHHAHDGPLLAAITRPGNLITRRRRAQMPQ